MNLVKNQNKGFTLVELLAVIVIMGILMMVAIPSVTRTIENSRKDTFVDIAKSYGNAARTLWTSDNLTCNGVVSSAVDDGNYYILINSKEGAKESLPVLVDQGGKSSWGNRDVNGYVRVNISTTPGEDTDGDGELDVEPKRLTKFYVALSDGTHGILDNDTSTMDELVRGNVNMTLSDDDLKKIELTVDDGRLDCARNASGVYTCAEVIPIKNITGICVDDQTNVGLTGNGGIMPVSFATDDWDTIVKAINSGVHPYSIGDTKEIDMGSFGVHTVRLANLSTPAECSNPNFSQTACGTVIEFADIITEAKMNSGNTNSGGWPAANLRSFLSNDIYNSLPIDLKKVITDTSVVSGHTRGASESNFSSIDKLYLLSPKEIWENGSSHIITIDSASENTRQLDYYRESTVTTNNYSPAIKQYNGSNTWWWLRTSYSISMEGFFCVSRDGNWTGLTVYVERGVSPAFRIG